MSSLFNLENVSLRKGDVFINKTKGLNCSYDYRNPNKWLVGKYVLNQLKKDKEEV